MIFGLHPTYLIAILAAAGLLLMLTSRDEDWIDYLERQARLDNQWRNFDFQCVAVLPWLLLAALAVFIYYMAAKDIEAETDKSPPPVAATPARHAPAKAHLLSKPHKTTPKAQHHKAK